MHKIAVLERFSDQAVRQKSANRVIERLHFLQNSHITSQTRNSARGLCARIYAYEESYHGRDSNPRPRSLPEHCLER